MHDKGSLGYIVIGDGGWRNGEEFIFFAAAKRRSNSPPDPYVTSGVWSNESYWRSYERVCRIAHQKPYIGQMLAFEEEWEDVQELCELPRERLLGPDGS